MAQEAAGADRYLPLSFVQLKEECKKRGLDTSGTKENTLEQVRSLYEKLGSLSA